MVKKAVYVVLLIAITGLERPWVFTWLTVI